MPLPHRADLTLRPVAPFDFRHTLARARRMRSSPSLLGADGGRLRAALRVDGAPLLAGVEASGSVERPALEVRLRSASPLGERTLAAAETRIRRWLRLDDDLAAFYALAERDPAFEPVLARLRGFRMLEHATPFEAACWAVVQQRTPNAFAYRTMARLAALLGDPVGADGETRHAFPEPATFVMNAREPILEATNNTRKTDRLVPLGQAFASLDEAWLRREPYGEVARRLKRIHGVGQWSVEYILLRGLARYERTPWTDTGLIPALSRLYTGGLAIDRGSARELAERYGWWQGLWAHYVKTYAFSPPEA